MKKRILSLLIAIILVIPCFVFNVSAATANDITLSDDYKSLVYRGVNYVRFNATITNWDYGSEIYGVEYDIDEINYVDYDLSVNDAIISATIYFTDGSSLSTSFISEEYYSEYQNILENTREYTVDFYFPEGNKVNVTSKKILGDRLTLTGPQLWDSQYFDVNAYCEDKSFSIEKGRMLVVDNKYYYVDYAENSVKDILNFYPNECDSLLAYKITDAETISALDKAYNDYNGDFIGLLNGDFSEGIGTVLLCIAFAIIPLAVFIIFLILFIRAKTPVYKKLFRATWITSATELVVFAVAVILLTVFK